MAQEPPHRTWRNIARAIAVDGSGNVYVTGESYGNGTGFDYATVKYLPDGTEDWVSRYNYEPGNSDDGASDLAIDDSGNVYVTGYSYGGYGGSGTGYDYATIGYDPNGNQIWVKRYDGPGTDDDFDWANAIAVDGCGNVYVTGRSEDSLGYRYDYVTIKYSKVPGAAPSLNKLGLFILFLLLMVTAVWMLKRKRLATERNN